MTIEATLEQAFNAYVKLARAELRPQKVTPTSPRPFELLRNRSMELRRLVDEIELTREFGELVNQTLATFPPEHITEPDSSVTDRAKEIGHFFRRSRCYTAIYGGKDIDTGTTFKYLIAEFRKEQFQIRRLIPLRHIGFSEDQIQFNGFEIRRFSAQYLNEIVQNNVMEVFYDWNTIDVSEIEGYWFIDLVQLESSRPKWRGISVDDLKSSRPVREEFSAFPKDIASVLEPLILYDWDSIEGSGSYSPTRCVSFDIPFVLKIADDLLHAPSLVPDIPPFQAGVVEKGEEVFPPDYWVFIDDADSDSFHSFVTHVDSILTRLRSIPSEWQFLEVALLFLCRAFFSEELEQLLWHITALEALLGEKKEGQGLTRLLGNRLALVLGRTKNERTGIRKFFEEIYDLRSRLVHGDEKLLDQKTHENHLREARNLARRTFIWFINYVDHVLHETQHDRALPNREELLGVLDLKIESVKHLLRILPADFPQPSTWLDR